MSAYSILINALDRPGLPLFHRGNLPLDQCLLGDRLRALYLYHALQRGRCSQYHEDFSGHRSGDDYPVDATRLTAHPIRR